MKLRAGGAKNKRAFVSICSCLHLRVRSRTRASEEESGYVSVLLFAFRSLFTPCVRREAVVHYHERSCSCACLHTCADFNQNHVSYFAGKCTLLGHHLTGC